MQPGQDTLKLASDVLGYLNFSSGLPDPRFLGNFNGLFGLVAGQREKAMPVWQSVATVLRTALGDLRGRSDAFRQTDQAEAVLALVFDRLPGAYRQFHRDLLFHQSDEALLEPFFLGRCFEAVLQQGGPWDQVDRIVAGALNHLNDYLGHRPVAVLRTQQKIQPYAARMGASHPAVDSRGGRGRGPLSRPRPGGDGHPGGDRSDAAAGGHVRSGAVG